MTTKPASAADRNAFIGRFAGELERLAAELNGFQDLIAQAIISAERADLMMRAQGFDELAQRAQCLADVARRYANDPALTRNNALAGVTLEALAQRLAGARDTAVAAGGEVDLF